MPKKSTGYTPTGKSKSNPLDKEATPLKNASLSGPKMPNPMDGGPNKVATMPGTRFPKLTRPPKMSPRLPKI